MWSSFSTTPYRQITRSIVTYQAAALSVTAALVGGDATRIVLMMALAKAWLIGQRGGDGRAALPTVNAIAQSLKRSPQTLYNQASALVQTGLCVQQGHAIVPAPTAAIEHWLAQVRFHAVTMIDELRQGSVPLPASVPSSTAGLERELAIFSLRMNLVGAEYNAQESDNWTEMCITAVIMAHNVRPLTARHAAAGDFGHAVAPLAARAQMPLADAAAALAMPYSTMARYAARMTGAGLLDRVDGGLIVSPAWMLQPGVLDRAEDIANYVGRRLHELQDYGFDFTQPLRHRNSTKLNAA